MPRCREDVTLAGCLFLFFLLSTTISEQHLLVMPVYQLESRSTGSGTVREPGAQIQLERCTNLHTIIYIR